MLFIICKVHINKYKNHVNIAIHFIKIYTKIMSSSATV